MFSIGHIRMGYAVLTMLTLTLLALRGYLCSRTKISFFFTVIVFMAGIADIVFCLHLLYGKA